MSTIIAFVSSQPKTGKTTLARVLAHAAAHRRWQVLLADCDPQKETSYHWLQEKQKDRIKVKIFPTVQQALRETPKYDLTILDGPPQITHAILEIAPKADLIIQPVGGSMEDLRLAAKEFQILVKAGAKKEKLLFVLEKWNLSLPFETAYQYLTKTGHPVLEITLSKQEIVQQIFANLETKK
ncbi:MAG: ParA-like plasmid partition protein [Mycoplasmataceae bacterium RC_NB112A]|nr:MAG: ParA-like plasmid partition protein [Mycoplasmataceae bacterium RC_NB112A]